MGLTVMNVEDLPEHLQDQARHKLGVEKASKKSKYNNKHTELDGIVFDSAKEAGRYAELQMLCKAGEICGLCLQVSFRLPGKVTYVADFIYYDIRNQKFVVEDAKGFRTKEYQIKKKLMREIGIEIEEV